MCFFWISECAKVRKKWYWQAISQKKKGTICVLATKQMLRALGQFGSLGVFFSFTPNRPNEPNPAGDKIPARPTISRQLIYNPQKKYWQAKSAFLVLPEIAKIAKIANRATGNIGNLEGGAGRDGDFCGTTAAQLRHNWRSTPVLGVRDGAMAGG